jgi:hypothetical protein
MRRWSTAWDRCAAVSVARDAHPAGIEQLPGRRGWPPSAAAVASAEFFPGHSAVLSLDPLRYLIPRDLAQVLKVELDTPGRK